MRSFICEAKDRLGFETGAPEIKQHPFFSGVDFDNLRRVRAPFEPRLSSNIDTAYFPIDEIPQEDNTAAIKARDASASNEEMAEMSLPFVGYTYKRFDAFRGQ